MLSLAGAVGGVMIAPSAALAHETAASTFTLLTVAGWAETKADPDIGHVQFSVDSDSDTADKALATNDVLAQQVVDAIKKRGIDSKNIEMKWPNVWPVYEELENPANVERPRKVIGYKASLTIDVTLSDLKLVSGVVTDGLKAGATGLDSVWYSLKDDTNAKGRAVEQAVSAANIQARLLADAAKLDLRGIARINLDDANVLPFSAFDGRGGGMQKYDLAVERQLPTLAPQPVRITARVAIEFNATAR